MPSDKKPEGQQPKGKAQKSAGAKDAKAAKTNRNISSSLPDRQKEAKVQADVTREMAEQETIYEPWQLRVLDLQSQGWSFERIIEEGEKQRKQTKPNATWGRNRVLLPSRFTLYKSTSSQPEFKEDCEKRFSFAVDAEAQRTLELSKSLDQIDGLKPGELVNARDKRIQRTLQVAGRIMPDKWGELASGDREVIVFEPYGGWVPTNLATGAPGQGAEAEAAKERWKKIREEAKDA